MATPAPFSNVPTQDEIARRQKMAQALMGQAVDASPVEHWTQALARVVKGGVGGMWDNQARQGQQDWQSAVMKALSGHPSFSKLGPDMQGMLSSSPELMNSVAGKVIGNQLDPNAGQQRQINEMRLRQLQLGIKQAKTQGARAEQLFPYELEAKRLAVEVAKANAGRKDVETQLLQSLGLVPGAAPQQPNVGGQPQLLPQSFEGGGMPQGSVQPVANAAGPNDPNMILTQGGQAAPSQPSPRDIVQGMTPGQKAQLGLSMIGKGDAAKVLGEAEDRQRLSQKARNKLDDDFIDATSSYQRLRDIQSSLDPKYLEWSTRIGMWGKSLAAKAGNLPKADQDELYRYATFRRDAASNLNLLVKERSGGAVTPQEFERQGVEIPNAGNGVFDGDDPVTFKAKLDRAYEVVALGMARNAWLRSSNPSNAGKSVAELSRMMPIERMRARINARAKSIEAEVMRQNPGLHKSFIDREVDRRVKAEFGI